MEESIGYNLFSFQNDTITLIKQGNLGADPNFLSPILVIHTILRRMYYDRSNHKFRQSTA